MVSILEEVNIVHVLGLYMLLISYYYIRSYKYSIILVIITRL